MTYKFSWEKKWKWWHWILLLPLLDFLVDFIMIILQLFATCLGSWYCAIGIFRLLEFFGGGNNENEITKKYLEMFPILIAMNMAASGKNVKEVILFLNKFDNPSVSISTLMSFVASSMCTPKKKIMEENMKKFAEEFKTYKYSGNKEIIKRFIKAMETDPNPRQITQKELDMFKNNFKNAIKTVIKG